MTKHDTTATEMRDSWLVQRLKKPFPTDSPLTATINSLAFGGGYRNGGLSDDAMGLLRQVFRFDYMGAAEFEWGAVPKTLSGLAKDQNHLTAFVVDVPLSVVPSDWRDKRKSPTLTGTASVYVFCRREHATEVRERVHAFAAGATETKEHVGLNSTLRPFTEWDAETCGWLELDNGYFFFTDRDMWQATSALFGVEVSS